MSLLKNTSGQKLRVFAYTVSTGLPLTGDAANITCKVAIDYGTATALTDTNPTETEDGYYLFDLTQAETNGNALHFYPESSTSGVQVLADVGSPYTVAASSGGTGTGARTVMPTVDDGTDPLQNAVIRFTEGANTFSSTTDINGQVASFNLDDATYVVSITKSGYTFAGTTLVVDGTETPTYSMTLNVVTPPANPDAITVQYLLVDSGLSNDVGVSVYYRMITPPSGDGTGLEQEWVLTTSNGSGIVTFAVLPGAEYEVAIDSTTGCKFRTTIADDAINGDVIAPNATYQKSS